MSNALMTTNGNSVAIMPVMDLHQAMERRQAIIDFTKKVMTPSVDYGRVPGTNKDTLLKPGAEKLTSLFGLSPRFEAIEKTEDWTGKNHDGEPFFYFQYRCSLYYGDILAGQGVGSCNSWEKKYRYRQAQLTCPNCNNTGTIIKGKAEYGGGWLCFARKGGCGAKFGDNAPAIVDQPRGEVPNPNPADLVNTIDKMAQKRALVAATLIAVNASEFFTQDVEDMDFGDVVEGEFAETPQRQPKPRPQQKRNGQPKKPVPDGTWEDIEAHAASNGKSDGPHDMTPANPETVALWRDKVEKGHRLKALTVAGMVANAVPYYDNDYHALQHTDYERDNTFTDNQAALEMFDGLVKKAEGLISN